MGKATLKNRIGSFPVAMNLSTGGAFLGDKVFYNYFAVATENKRDFDAIITKIALITDYLAKQMSIYF